MNLKYNTYHTFENNGNYYLFDNENLFSCTIDKHVYDALRYNNISLLTSEELQMFETFHKQGIFFIDEPQDKYSFPKHNILIVSMALLHGCNLNCKYCFADAGRNFTGKQREFNECSITAAIDFLLNDPYLSRNDYYRINLVSGGEPLLNKALFRQFIEIAFSQFEKANKHLYVWFSTNGTLLSEDDLLFVSKYNVGYGISLDGNRSDNDKLRVYNNGSGTYDDIVHNIRTIQQSTLVPKRLKELWGLMVYTRDNSNLLENIKHLKALGFSTVQMRFVRSNNARLMLNDHETIQILLDYVSTLFNQAIAGDDSLLRMICNDSDYLGKIIKRVVLQTPVETRCGAGSCMLSFAADGNIYPCDCFVGNPEYVMGNFYTSISQEALLKYQDLSVHNREKCKMCWARYACGGDCYHNSYIKHGNILSPDDSYCEIIIKVIEYIVAYINQYQMQNQEGYSAFQSFLYARDLLRLK